MTRFIQQNVQNGATNIPVWAQQPLNSFIGVLPELVGALIILIIGWIAGRIVGGIVRRLVDRVELDRLVTDTPLGKMLGGTEKAVSTSFGKIAKWFIYALAILAAANVLAIPLLSEWIATAVTYLPSFLAGLIIIILGFILADFVADTIRRTEMATRTGYTRWFSNGARIFLYFIALVIGLDTIGVDVELLYIFAQAISWGIAAGLALAIGIGFGWGSKDYIAENIEDWMEKTQEYRESE